MSRFHEGLDRDGAEEVDGGEALMRISAHERLCAWRYNELLSRVGRLEGIIVAAAGTIIVGMGGIILTLALRGH